MRRYSLLQPLYLSFFSEDLYRDVRTNWKGTGFLYLLVLLALTWLPVMAGFHGAISREVRQEAPQYIAQVPEITIVKGEVSIDRPVPYTISDPESRAPIMIIDTEGTITSLEQTKAPVLLTRNKFMYRQQHRAETRIYDLSEIDHLTVDGDDVRHWVELFRKYFIVIAYPFALAGSFVFRVLQMLLYAAIGLLFVKAMKAGLDYLSVLRLASVSITPVILLHMMLVVTHTHVRFQGLVAFGIAMGYLFFAVKVNGFPEETGTGEA